MAVVVAVAVVVALAGVVAIVGHIRVCRSECRRCCCIVARWPRLLPSVVVPEI